MYGRIVKICGMVNWCMVQHNFGVHSINAVKTQRSFNDC